MSEQYRISTRVVRVQEKEVTLRGYMKDGQKITETGKLGWYVTLEGSRESLYLGHDKPSLDEGQLVDIVIQPR